MRVPVDYLKAVPCRGLIPAEHYRDIDSPPQGLDTIALIRFRARQSQVIIGRRSPQESAGILRVVDELQFGEGFHQIAIADSVPLAGNTFPSDIGCTVESDTKAKPVPLCLCCC